MSYQGILRVLITISGTILAWIVLFGLSNFNWATRFVPWHHDDFGALAGFTRLDLSMVRPVSGNFELFFGQFGEATYYLVIWFLVFTLVTVTIEFTITLFSLRFSPTLQFWFSATTAAMFFSTAYATEAFQYLGLQTNLLSYIFGLAAGTILLRRSASVWSLVAVFLLVTLSAFSKEDMAAFLGVVVLARLWRDRGQGPDQPPLAGRAHRLIALVALPYGLSVAHSLAFGSPFLSNNGPYQLSAGLNNLIHNWPLYVAESQGVQATFALFGAAVLLLVVACIIVKSLRQYLLATVTATALVGSLLLPYLLLPRVFSWYTLNFFPLLASCLVALVLILIGALPASRRAIPTLRSGLACIALVLTPLVLDFAKRAEVQLDYATKRKNMAAQFQEIGRLSASGLTECQSVLVTGVSDIWSPFTTWDTRYLNHRFGLQASWIVVTLPDTRLATFGKPFPSANDPIRFISQDTLTTNPKAISYDCQVDFTPATVQATFRHLDTPLALAIIAFGPTNAKAGAGFNLQPNHQSALWLKASVVRPGVVAVWNGTALTSSVVLDQRIVTALVPEALVATPGTVSLTLRDPATNEESPPVPFLLTP